MKISIVGVGAIGATIAAHLAEAGKVEKLQLCARQGFEKIQLDQAQGQIIASPIFITKPTDAQSSEWVFVATKAHQVESAKNWFSRLNPSATKIAVLQNGVEHKDRLRQYFNNAEILPVVVDCPAVRLNQTNRLTLSVRQSGSASLTVENNALGKEFRAFFENTAVQIKLSDDFQTDAWKKLCVNVAGGAIATLTGQALGVLHQPGMAYLAKALIKECIAVGQCEGAKLKENLAQEIVQNMLLHSKDSLTSMLVDRRAGKKLEIDARNGAVVRLGRKHNIDTPLNKMVVTILSAVNR